jgi:hypothetical protein
MSTGEIHSGGINLEGGRAQPGFIARNRAMERKMVVLPNERGARGGVPLFVDATTLVARDASLPRRLAVAEVFDVAVGA